MVVIKNVNCENLVNDKSLRDQYLEKLDVLDKVKEVVFMPNTSLMTTKMASEYYDVGEEAINSLIKDNKEELVANGLTKLTGEQLKSFKDTSQYKSRARELYVISRRVLLNIGMLLRDSEIAKKVRSYLLDVEEKADEKIKENIINEENVLLLDIINAEDKMTMAVGLNKYKQYQDRHKRELQEVIDSQSKLKGSKKDYVNQTYIGNSFNVKLGNITVGKLLRIIGIAQMGTNKTIPYQSSIPKYAQNFLDERTETFKYVWHYKNFIEKLDSWLKEHGLYEEFYKCNTQKNLMELINRLHKEYVEDRRYAS